MSKRPLKLILYVRKDGVTQHYHVADERQPRLNHGTLRGNINIQDDRLLRASNPRELVNGVMVALQAKYPLPKQIDVVYGSSKLRLIQHYRAIGHPHPERYARALFASDANAVFNGHAIVLLPSVYRQFQSSNMMERAVAMRTIAHEYWHALKGYSQRYNALEEGGAEWFSTEITNELLSSQLDFSAYISYRHPLGAVRMLEGQLGKQWLLDSRLAPDQHLYLKDSLGRLGLSQDEIQHVVSYNQETSEGEFLAALEDALARR